VTPLSPVAVVAGATGAVGTRLLARLLERTDGTRILAVGRRPPAISDERIRHLPATLGELRFTLAGLKCTEAFCCLGTTMRTAGSKAAFRVVDLDGVAEFALAARATGAGFFGLVSAAGANPRSRNFYLRTKGEAEALVAAQGFPSLAILQPGLLRGPRVESRPMERLGQFAAPLLDPLLRGPLARYRSVEIDKVAAVLDAAARAHRPGVLRISAAAIEAFGGPR
jgi:uncharacterized protein YbjT (DUF2867 family)